MVDQTMLEIKKLETLEARHFRTLLDQESEIWRDHLGWTYAAPPELLSRSVTSSALAGYACVEAGKPLAYTYYVSRNHKAIIGSAFVLAQFNSRGLLNRVVDHTLTELRANTAHDRIESQPMIFGQDDAARVFKAHGFESFEREFLACELTDLSQLLKTRNAYSIRPLAKLSLRSTAEIAHSSFQGSADEQMSSCYGSIDNCQAFLDGIMRRHGCGIHLAKASFAAYHEDQPVGLILTSQIGARAAHVVQLSVRPAQQRDGCGSALLGAAVDALAEHRFRRLTLSVSVANEHARRWYKKLGFETLKSFAAYLWTSDL